MEKQLTIVVPNAIGEDGLTRACKRGDLFRHNSQIEKFYKEGYVIHDYSIVSDDQSNRSTQTLVKVLLKK